MASYYDEHDCVPLRAGESPDHSLHLARLLITGGYWHDMQLEFNHMFADKPPPPACKEFVENLELKVITDKDEMDQCPVCLKNGEVGEHVKQLPCKHKFHSDCIIPWLKKTSVCPVCRRQLPTGNKDYEEYLKQKKRLVDREADLEILHDSMFS